MKTKHALLNKKIKIRFTQGQKFPCGENSGQQNFSAEKISLGAISDEIASGKVSGGGISISEITDDESSQCEINENHIYVHMYCRRKFNHNICCQNSQTQISRQDDISWQIAGD